MSTIEVIVLVLSYASVLVSGISLGISIERYRSVRSMEKLVNELDRLTNRGERDEAR
jgi:hypothetical protein